MTPLAAPDWLPAEPHVPGRTPRPDDALFAPMIDALETCATPAQLAASRAFAAGFIAFDAGYFWEAHELWEPVWMRAAPASREKLLMQGLIQLANAALKRRMAREAAAARILMRADHALSEAFSGASEPILGLDSDYIASLRDHALRN